MVQTPVAGIPRIVGRVIGIKCPITTVMYIVTTAITRPKTAITINSSRRTMIKKIVLALLLMTQTFYPLMGI